VPNVEETAAYYTEFGLAPKPAAAVSGAAPSRCSRAAPSGTSGDWDALPGSNFFWYLKDPASVLHPEDLAAMMTGAHSAR
jgi:hypothetical protein